MELGGVARDTGYEAAIQDALDAETAIAEAEAQVENKRVTRDEKVAALAAKTALVINGVIGNQANGPHSDLYGAMGYACRAVAGGKAGPQIPTPERTHAEVECPAAGTSSTLTLSSPRAARNARCRKAARVFLFPAAELGGFPSESA